MVNVRRDLLRFRIELDGIAPAIWREIVVPARYSFWDLHVAIQDAMGWWDCHLHEFRVRDPGRGTMLHIGIPTDDALEGVPEIFPGWNFRVRDLLSPAGDHMEYVYDFGDAWTHQVALLGIEPRVKGQRYPLCLAGERACPPEDCGGVPGYETLVAALLDPEHEEFESLSEWIPKGWTPEGFRPQRVHFDSPARRWKQAFLADE